MRAGKVPPRASRVREMVARNSSDAVAATVMAKRPKLPQGTEPEAPPGAPAPMSAQLRPEDAAPPRVVHVRPARHPSDPGEVAFDRWLKRELGRLYDETLSEPVPEELTRLLDQPPAKPPETGGKG